MSGLLRSLRLAGTIAAEAALVAGLVALGRRPAFAVPVAHPGPWLRDGDPATVTIAVLRWCALVGAVWLLLSTVLYALAALSGVPAAVRAVRWSTLPAVRRAVDAACALSVATTVVLAPVAAGASGRPRGPSADPPGVSLVRDGHGDGSLARLPADGTPPSTPPTSAPTTAPTATAPPAGIPPPAAPLAAVRGDAPPVALPDDVVVVDGDDLWTLAAARVATATGRSPEAVPADEVAPYWVLVCDTNRTRLASGDPNLVYPGEHVVLPPVSPR
jgi:hypothetical protein